MLINLSTKQRVWEHDFRTLFPNTSFPVTLTDDVLSPLGYAVIVYPDPPIPSTFQVLEDNGVLFVNGAWTAQYSLRDMTSAEISIAETKLQNAITSSVQRLLDTTARTHNYDSMISLCSYVASTNAKFKAEAIAGAAWRDAVWAKCYDILAQVQAGTIPIPSVDGLLSQLPTFTWPD